MNRESTGRDVQQNDGVPINALATLWTKQIDETSRVFRDLFAATVPVVTGFPETTRSVTALANAVGPPLGAKAMTDLSLQAARFDVVSKTLAWLGENQSTSWSRSVITEDIARELKRLTDFNWPPNLRGCDSVSLEVMIEIVGEGIPLFLVPRREIVTLLFAASDSVQRRAIIGRKARPIVEDCKSVLQRIEAATDSGYAEFLLESVAAFDDSHYAASQALSTTTLDTLIGQTEIADKRILKRYKDGPSDEELLELRVTKYLAFGPIRNAHTEWDGGAGVPPPFVYSRHASVHGVSDRQYSKRNAVIALMTATSILGFYTAVAQD